MGADLVLLVGSPGHDELFHLELLFPMPTIVDLLHCRRRTLSINVGAQLPWAAEVSYKGYVEMARTEQCRNELIIPDSSQMSYKPAC